MSTNTNWYLYTGILSLGYTIYAFANYYTFGGIQLIKPGIEQIIIVKMIPKINA